jgi:glycosyltransferase involved in cell wall biosynthesis
MTYSAIGNPQSAIATESLRLEAVTVCVGFDDLLDVTLGLNHPHLDTLIIVTAHDDRATQAVAQKYGAICVQTDLFSKNGRNFNKGAAINAGFARFQYHGWRLHLDADIALPDNFRRILFNHTALDRDCIYGADRVDVLGRAALESGRCQPQHAHGFLIAPQPSQPLSARYVDTLRGYVPIGFFQLWHCSTQKDYPFSIGTAAHDDVAFADQWPARYRRHLPTVICHHLVTQPPQLGENWDGRRSQPRIS